MILVLLFLPIIVGCAPPSQEATGTPTVVHESPAGTSQPSVNKDQETDPLRPLGHINHLTMQPVPEPTTMSVQILEGEVLNAGSGTSVAGAAVEVPKYGLSTQTDSQGRFSFEIREKPYTPVRVRIIAQGFRVKNEDPMLGTGQFQIYRLKEKRE